MFDSSSDEDSASKPKVAPSAPHHHHHRRHPQPPVSTRAFQPLPPPSSQKDELDDILGSVVTAAAHDKGVLRHASACRTGGVGGASSHSLTTEAPKFAAALQQQHSMRQEEKHERQIDRLQREAVKEAAVQGESVDFTSGFITADYKHVLAKREAKRVARSGATNSKEASAAVEALVATLAKKRSGRVDVAPVPVDFGEGDFYDAMTNASKVGASVPAAGSSAVRAKHDIFDGSSSSDGGDDDLQGPIQSVVESTTRSAETVPPPTKDVDHAIASVSSKTPEETEASDVSDSQGVTTSTAKLYQEAIADLAKAKRSRRIERAKSKFDAAALSEMKRSFDIRQAAQEAARQRLFSRPASKC